MKNTITCVLIACIALGCGSDSAAPLIFPNQPYFPESCGFTLSSYVSPFKNSGTSADPQNVWRYDQGGAFGFCGFGFYSDDRVRFKCDGGTPQYLPFERPPPGQLNGDQAMGDALFVACRAIYIIEAKVEWFADFSGSSASGSLSFETQNNAGAMIPRTATLASCSGVADCFPDTIP